MWITSELRESSSSFVPTRFSSRFSRSPPSLPSSPPTLSLPFPSHSYWGGDLSIPSPRPAYQINATSPGTDAAVSAAAAFASAAFLYTPNNALTTSSSAYSPPAGLVNQSYATTLLGHARDLYAFANSTTRQVYQVAVPQVKDIYASSGWEDGMVWGGLWVSFSKDVLLFELRGKRKERRVRSKNESS